MMDFLRAHTVPLTDFRLHWRFGPDYAPDLPAEHRQQLRPLDARASRWVWDYIVASGLHDDTPFKKGFFRTIDRAAISTGNQADIRKWLYRRGLPFAKEVILSWQPDEAMLVPWKLVVKYFDAFYYPAADDLTVFDGSLSWALLFYHEDEIYFGTNEPFVPGPDFDEWRFSW